MILAKLGKKPEKVPSTLGRGPRFWQSWERRPDKVLFRSSRIFSWVSSTKFYPVFTIVLCWFNMISSQAHTKLIEKLGKTFLLTVVY